MTTKTLTITEDAYERLAMLKEGTEGISSMILDTCFIIDLLEEQN
ncbi:MAG: hypothetical protein AABX13_05595 [Nanoarchaeota archaeon]